MRGSDVAQKIIIRLGSFNDTYLPLLDDTTRNQFVYGGAGSGKSVFLARRGVLDVARSDRNYLIARGTQRAIRGSTWNEVLDAIGFFGLRPYFLPNKSELTITCLYNERQFVFVGCDDIEKIKSIRPRVGVFTDLWEEEATEISAPSDKQLRLRLRGPSSLPKRYIYSFNPIYKAHHLYTRYFAPLSVPEEVRLLRKDNILILRTTYRDNRFLTQEDVEELLAYREGDPYWYQVYAEGKWGVLGHRIFSDWEVRDLSKGSTRVADEEWRNGLDFGFTNDPTALSRSYRAERELRFPAYWGGELYAPGLTNPEIAARVRPVIGAQRVYCDCSEPKSIRELRQAGANSINAVGVKKGKDSVLHGLQWLQRHRLVVDPQNQHAINELSLARWKEDRDGNPYNVPVDANNHWLDATRYAWERDMTSRKPMMVVSARAARAAAERRAEDKEKQSRRPLII